MIAKFLVAFLFVMFIFYVLWKSQTPLVTALYIFGDSTVDAGNNNLLETQAKSNYAPYGIDYPDGITGRPTNGHTIADFLALSFGLKPPAAFRLVNISTYDSHQGFNYASSSAGILPDTGFNGTLSFGDQVGLFKKTVEEFLPLHFKNHDAISEHLSRSIFLVFIGLNDYALNFLRKKSMGQSPDEDKFADLLLEKLKSHVTDMFNLGARKIVVFDIGAMGCLPLYVRQIKPLNSKCVDDINSLVFKYNERLGKNFPFIQQRHPGLLFIIGKNYEHMISLVQNPKYYGLKDASNPCCVTTPYGTCEAKRPPCSDRKSRVFFDAFHQTEAAYKILAQASFNGVGSVIPLNIQELAKQSPMI